MPDTVIHPTAKFIKAGFVCALLLLVGAVVVQYQFLPPGFPWLPLVTAVILLGPLSALMRRRFTRIVISGEKLYCEEGALSKQTRIIQLPKIQDVRVHQSISQRMFGVGDLSIETAGEASRLTIRNIDEPRALAERILELANQEHGPKR